MIPLLTTNDGVPALPQNGGPPDDAAADDAPTFGTLVALAEGEVIELPVPVADDAALLQPMDRVEIPEKAAPVAMPALADVSQAAKTDAAEPELAKQDRPISSGLPPKPEVRATVAQSVVEGRIPQSDTGTNALAKAPPSGQPNPDVQAIKGLAEKPLPVAAPSQHKTAAAGALVATDPQVSRTTPEVRLAQSVKEQPAIQPARPEAVMAKETVALPDRPAPRFSPPMTLAPPPAIAALPTSVMATTDAGERTASVDVPDIGLMPTSAERAGPVSTPAAPQAAVNADATRHIANQLVVAVTNMSGKTTEIALSPVELGRVRLSMTATDGALTVTILAERPETSDLLRRHIDTLAQEFRDLGYEDLSFSFGSDSHGGSTDHLPDAQTGAVAVSDTSNDTITSPHTTATSGLDLRL